MFVHEQYTKVFKAPCDERRLKILDELSTIGQPTLSYHMRILCDSGIVQSHREGKWPHYSLDKEGSVFDMDLLKRLTTANSDPFYTYCCE